MDTNSILDSGTTPKKSPAGTAVKWALVGTLLGIIQTFAGMYLNDGKYDPRGDGIGSMAIGFIILFFVLFMSMKEFRDKEQGGYITYGKAFQAGFITSLFWTLFTLVFMVIFYNFIIDFDTYMSEQMDKGIQEMKKRGMSDSEIQNAMSKTPAFFSSQGFSLAIVAVASIIFQVVATLITAIFVKKDRPHS